MDAYSMALEKERTKRMFIQTIGAALGVDQSYAEADNQAINWPGQYAVYGSTYGYAQEGQPVSQAQTESVVPLLLLVLGGFVLWKVVG